MGYLEAIVLGALQGLTEFLPVSSSGHLVLAQHLFGLREPQVLFDVLLHLATLCATVLVLRSRVWELLKACGRFPKFLAALFNKGHLAIGDDPAAWMVLLLLVSTAITGTIGVVFRKTFEAAFTSVTVVGVGLTITGLLLFFAQRTLHRGEKNTSRATLRDAAWIGFAQGLAITPGLSRSGSTISAGLLAGFDRKLAGEYAFLVSLPAILGAVILEGLQHSKETFPPLGLVVAGFIPALVLGVISLKLLLGWIERGSLRPFAYYCWALAILAFGLSLM